MPLLRTILGFTGIVTVLMWILGAPPYMLISAAVLGIWLDNDLWPWMVRDLWPWTVDDECFGRQPTNRTRP